MEEVGGKGGISLLDDTERKSRKRLMKGGHRRDRLSLCELSLHVLESECVCSSTKSLAYNIAHAMSLVTLRNLVRLFSASPCPQAPCRRSQVGEETGLGEGGIRWLRRAWSDPANQNRRFEPRPAKSEPDRGRFPRLGKLLLGDFAAVPPGSRAGPLPFVAEKEDSTPNFSGSIHRGESLECWVWGWVEQWRVWKGGGRGGWC